MHAVDDLRAWEVRLSQRIRTAIADRELLFFMGDEREFKPFLALFDVVDLREGNTSQMKDGAFYFNHLAEMVHMHAQRRTSHVLIAGLNENWGAFSTQVSGRTADWGVWQEHLANARCTPELVRQYLDDPAVKAVVTPHHTVFWHPKILSLPVGMKEEFLSVFPDTSLVVEHLGRAAGAKTQDLLINSSDWGHRPRTNARVIANFGGRIANTFGLPKAEFFQAVTHARFVLCPSGLGWDTSRIWETLTLGSIPVIEYSQGWHTVLDELPALFVTNFDEVTPALLARNYPEILSACERFDFGKLTKEWWGARIKRLLAPFPTGN